jgi:hypothetical protein
MDIEHSLRVMIERGLRPLKLDRKLAILADLASGRDVADLPYSSPEERFAFNQGLQKLKAQITPEIARSVAASLILELTQGEINRQVSQEKARPLPPPPRRPRSRKGNSNRGPHKVVVGGSDALRADELAEFLALFDKTYALGISLPEGAFGVAGPSPDRISLVAQFRRYGRSRRPFSERASPLVIAKIRKSSPLTIWFEAVASVLVAAVIISGGEVDLLKGKFKVHSLGEGLKKLKEVFGGPATRTTKKRSVKGSRRG